MVLLSRMLQLSIIFCFSSVYWYLQVMCRKPGFVLLSVGLDITLVINGISSLVMNLSFEEVDFFLILP